jgi:hypothetical protein
MLRARSNTRARGALIDVDSWIIAISELSKVKLPGTVTTVLPHLHRTLDQSDIRPARVEQLHAFRVLEETEDSVAFETSCVFQAEAL